MLSLSIHKSKKKKIDDYYVTNVLFLYIDYHNNYYINVYAPFKEKK